MAKAEMMHVVALVVVAAGVVAIAVLVAKAMFLTVPNRTPTVTVSRLAWI
jgi:hypothetical protein